MRFIEIEIRFRTGKLSADTGELSAKRTAKTIH